MLRCASANAVDDVAIIALYIVVDQAAPAGQHQRPHRPLDGPSDCLRPVNRVQLSNH